MSQKPQNIPAFPGGVNQTYTAMEPGDPTQEGMTLRDYFAAAAMQGMLPNSNEGFRMLWSEYAEASYQIADAMLAERAKQ